MIAWFAIIGFIGAVLQAAWVAVRWWQVPRIEVLQANFSQRHGALHSVGPGDIVLLASGGARSRRVINWGLVIGAKGDDGNVAGAAGVSRPLEPINEVIPAHDVVKITLTTVPEFSSAAYTEPPEKCAAILSLDLGRYDHVLKFDLIRLHTGNYALAGERVRSFFEPGGRWYARVERELKKRLW